MSKTILQSRKFFAILLLTVAPALCQSNRSLAKTAPRIQSAVLPDYPAIAVAAHITGKVTVLVTVQRGCVIDTHPEPGSPAISNYLQTATILNIQTWRFGPDVNEMFSVTYTYDVAGEPSDGTTNPHVEILPTLDVRITARPMSIN